MRDHEIDIEKLELLKRHIMYLEDEEETDVETETDEEYVKDDSVYIDEDINNIQKDLLWNNVLQEGQNNAKDRSTCRKSVSQTDATSEELSLPGDPSSVEDVNFPDSSSDLDIENFEESYWSKVAKLEPFGLVDHNYFLSSSLLPINCYQPLFAESKLRRSMRKTVKPVFTNTFEIRRSRKKKRKRKERQRRIRININRNLSLHCLKERENRKKLKKEFQDLWATVLGGSVNSNFIMVSKNKILVDARKLIHDLEEKEISLKKNLLLERRKLMRNKRRLKVLEGEPFIKIEEINLT